LNTLIANKNIIWFFLFFHWAGYAHNVVEPVVDSTFIQDEQAISQLTKALIEVRFDDEKVLVLSEKLNEAFKEVLKKENSFDYPFDSIPFMGKVVSEDGLVRIFTWYAVKTDGSYIYFGFIQYYNKVKKQVQLYSLVDKSDEVEDEKNASLSNQNWYGATYYEIVQSKSNYGTLYVLLGWDGNTLFSNKKVLESLVFSESGRPKFGKPVFVTGKIKVKRIVFEYSRMASMMLKYDSESKMIIMDHLSPSSPIYQGNTQFYGPDLSYDALKYEDGHWVYYPKIDYKPIEIKKRFKRKNNRN
jgi:hypothetical protein